MEGDLVEINFKVNGHLQKLEVDPRAPYWNQSAPSAAVYELRAISAWLKKRARIKPTGKAFFVRADP